MTVQDGAGGKAEPAVIPVILPEPPLDDQLEEIKRDEGDHQPLHQVELGIAAGFAHVRTVGKHPGEN